MRKYRWLNNRKPMRPQIKAALLVLLFFLAVIALYLVGYSFEKRSEKAEPRGNLSERFTKAPVIEWKGKFYQRKTKLSTLLVMGVDHDTEAVESGFRNGGQADYLMLLVIDAQEKTITPIQIDRDTMAEVTVLGVLGNETGTRTTQICLSHGFGNGGKQSCRLTVEAVNRLLPGAGIQDYLAMDLGGIAVLNDALGGITVTLEDDFTVLDPAMASGATLTLRGVQAEYYVRNRRDIGIGTNEARMKRQQTYWEGLNETLKEKLNDQWNTNDISNLFDQIAPSLTTDLKKGKIVNMLWDTRDYQSSAPVHPKGEYKVGQDGFMEFHADEDALEELVTQTFYRPVD